MKFICGTVKNILSKLLFSCFSLIISSSLIFKWNRPFYIVVLLIPFTLFVLFGVMDEKMLPKSTRTPIPFSVNPLYPSRVPLLDLPSFAYIINNDVCQDRKIFILVIVHSHPANRDRRVAMRRNIPTEDLADLGMRRVFLLARAEWSDQILYKKTPQDETSEENVIHRDIVQGNFKEHYHNLTYKHVMGLQWVNSFCPQARFIIKMDDDIVVDLYRFRDLLKTRYEKRDNLILGLLQISASPMRNPKSKWYVSTKDYPEDMYPNFLSGWAYAMTSDASLKIVNMSHRVPYFWIDDVYVTGVLATATGVKREGLNKLYTTHVEHLHCCVELPHHADYYCDYYVGPCDGDVVLMEKVMSHARTCFVQPCLKRTFGQRLNKLCIVVESPGNPHSSQGRGEVFKVY